MNRGPPAPKPAGLSLGSPSFSILFLKISELEKYLVVARCTEMWLRMHGVPPISPSAKKQRNAFTDVCLLRNPTLRLTERAQCYLAQIYVCDFPWIAFQSEILLVAGCHCADYSPYGGPIGPKLRCSCPPGDDAQALQVVAVQFGRCHPHRSKMLLQCFLTRNLAQSVAKPYMRRIAVEPWMPSH